MRASRPTALTALPATALAGSVLAAAPATEPAYGGVANLTRLETYGDTATECLKVTVDPRLRHPRG